MKTGGKLAGTREGHGDAVTGQAEWEALCTRCGLCCFEKIENERGTIFFTRTPCRYLDIATRECKVYEQRFAINPECVKLTPKLVEEIRWLHAGCGYRKASGIAGGPEVDARPEHSAPKKARRQRRNR